MKAISKTKALELFRQYKKERAKNAGTNALRYINLCYNVVEDKYLIVVSNNEKITEPAKYNGKIFFNNPNYFYTKSRKKAEILVVLSDNELYTLEKTLPVAIAQKRIMEASEYFLSELNIKLAKNKK